MKNKGNYLYEGNVLELFYKASNILNESAEHTLGVAGLNTAVPTSNGFLSIINDGKSIIENIASDDKALNLALNTLKESSLATNMNAGDGTTSTLVLQHSLLYEVKDKKEFTSNILITMRDILLNNLSKYVSKVETEEDLEKIITVSLGSNKFTPMLLEAFKAVGEGQKPSLIKTKNTTKTEVTTVEGVSLAPVEVNPVVLANMPLVEDLEVNVILFNQSINRIDQSFASILNKISQSKNKTILIYNEIMPSVMDQLLFNIQEGSLNLIPVRLACSPDKIDVMFKELERFFNCKAYTSLNSYQQADMQEAVGTGTGYILNKDSIVIKNKNEEYSSELLPSKSSYISVGFITFSQQEEDFRRIEDAIHSAYNAIQYGYVAGAGLTFKKLSLDLKEQVTIEGLNIFPVTEALQKIYNIIINSTEDITDSYIEQNIFDSYKVAEQVILNAFTVVAQVKSVKEILINY